MNIPLISIIVPVYKTNIDLLKRCVASIVSQTFENLEILLILNGNTTDYVNMVRKTIYGDSIRISEIDSIGPSAARNEGLRLAKGEFIAFVDADDEVTPTYIEEALNVIKATGTDVAVGGSRYQFDGYDRLLCYTGDTVFLQGIDACSRLLTASDGQSDGINGYLFSSVWGKLFRREALECVRFNEDVSFYEDMLFMFSIAIEGASFALSPKIWYTYYQYSHSLLHSKNEKTIHNFHIILRIINKKIIEKKYEDFLCVPYGSFILWCIQFSVQTADKYSRFADFISNCERMSLLIGLIDKLGERTNRYTKFCIKHRLYRLYYVTKKTRQFIVKHKPSIKKERLIQID